MKLSEKLYQWFYAVDKPAHKSNRLLINMINGGGTGLTIWLLSLMVDRMIGLPSEVAGGTFFWYLPHFVTGGVIIGAIIGMVSKEVLWHKTHASHQKKE